MHPSRYASDFLQYLAGFNDVNQGDRGKLPSLSELSDELNISIAKLREQLEVARSLGLVDVRPRTGIRLKPYKFLPAVRQSLLYAIGLDWGNFEYFADLRKHVEIAYWYQAVEKLYPEDHQELLFLVDSAYENLNGQPIKIPHSEHRKLHLSIFKRLENPFVKGILEAYWEAYESVGLNLYTDYEYLKEVWDYHQRIVDAICAGDLEASYQAFVDHLELIYHRHDNTTIGKGDAERLKDDSLVSERKIQEETK